LRELDYSRRDDEEKKMEDGHSDETSGMEYQGNCQACQQAFS
jgi:hypothetical protein